MKSKTLRIIKARKQLSMFYYFRGMFQPAKAFHLFLVLSYAPFHLTACEPCSINEVQKTQGCDCCGDNHHVGFQETIVGYTNSGHDAGTSMTHFSVESICTDPNSCCLPSTLPDISIEQKTNEAGSTEVSRSQSDSAASHIEQSNLRGLETNKSRLSNHNMFKLLDGRMVHCSLYSSAGIHEFLFILTDDANPDDISSCRGPLLSQKSRTVKMERNKEATKLCSFHSLSSPKVDVSPPVMDWGRRYLFLTSVGYLTVANTCNDSGLHIYEPFSTNIQFYPCNSSEILLGPGEVASICFVFLPRWVGFISAHLILQTSSGGFLVQARGFAVESPYEIQPLVGLYISSSQELSKNLSLFNPFDETLYVEEITSWISVSLGNTTQHTGAVCSIENFQCYNGCSLLSAGDWLVMNSSNSGFPLIATRLNKNREIKPKSSESIIEIDLSSESKGRILGAFCMQLSRSSQGMADIVMVPLEADLHRNSSYDDSASSLSVSLDAMMVPYGGNGVVFVAISLKNSAPYVLSVVRISEVANTKVFHIKLMEGLLLFPGAVTQVAAITCAELRDEIHDSASEIPDIINSCKLLIMTNESISPQIEISCEDILHICVEHYKDSSMAYKHRSETAKFDNAWIGSFGNGMQLASWDKTAEVDELVLRNWKTQGTTDGVTVLDDHELLFPMIQVGSHCSKWITVTNPSKQPVVMQLILNSGEIVDECRSQDDFIKLRSGGLDQNSSIVPMRFGFSMGENAQTEAYVQPYGRASFGPILFHPSNRCGWRSSALVRNNLSGVEWLPLRGFGGSVSLALFEGSDPVQSVEFNLNLLTSLIMIFNMDETTCACSQPFSKELYAKNTGDLPLEVRRIEVSGTECAVDGFVVHSCTSFYLEPGQSTKLLISYQTDFSSAVVQRDLELALATGIFVIPMKATLPVYMLNLCKRSVFWMWLKKLPMAILLSVSLLFLIFCFLVHQEMVLGSQYYFFKSEEKISITTIRTGGGFSRANRNQRNSKFYVSNGRYPNSHVRTKEQELSGPNAKLTPGSDRELNGFLDPVRETSLQSLPSKSAVAENPNIKEAPQAGYLSIRIEKEKIRRRRKRKGGFRELIEVSSSQSGNSRPSSSLSPITSVLPHRKCLLSSDVDQSFEARNRFIQLADQTREKGQVSGPISKENLFGAKVSVEHGCNNWATPSMLSSSSPLSLTSVIAPYARAPGSQLSDQKTINAERKGRLGDKYTYNIWGDHFPVFHLMGSSKDVALSSSTPESDPNSFFVRGPQSFMKNI
ncbi:hypothetical protein V6N13_052591 [Hibiscus sabdariffa]|uniref:Uncharacterized protein n=2 Tax=Hibiscus sabdariffa TaxID=183260 RepID=A0ABR1ZAR4_9ROSI